MLRMIAVAALVLLASVPAFAAEVKVGDSVIAFWDPGKADFVGTAVEQTEKGFLVVFEDGDQVEVAKTEIRLNDIKAGSTVMARWEDGEFYRGKVAKIVGRALFIEFDDGDTGWVAWSEIGLKK